MIAEAAIDLQFVPKTVVFIINVLVRLEILQYNILWGA